MWPTTLISFCKQHIVGMFSPLSCYVMLGETIPTHVQLNRHLKSKIKGFICHFAVFLQPNLISSWTLPFLPRTRWIRKHQMAPKICRVKFLLWQSSSTWKMHRTGQYASKPTISFLFLFYFLTSASLGIASGSLPKTELAPGRVRWNNCYRPAFIHPKHLFPCCFPWKNVNFLEKIKYY